MASLVNFLLFKCQMKEPKTKADVLNIASKEYEDHFIEIFMRASVCMEITSGFDVKEVDPTNHCYAILIKMGLTYDGVLDGEKEMPKTSILILILSVIFMKGNRATGEEVWEVLSVMGLYPWRKHYIFAKHRKLITNYFMKEEYMKYNTSRWLTVILYSLNSCGPKSHTETTKMQALEFLAKVHDTDPSSFPPQYEEALQDGENPGQNFSQVCLDFHGHCQF